MNLIIDQGNTVAKISLYAGDKEVLFRKTENPALSASIDELMSEHRFEKAIYSSVAADDDRIVDLLKKNIPLVIQPDDKTPLPVKVAYKTPETLGKDRLAGVVGACYLHPGKDILVVDAGTAVTFDFIDAQGVYHGGNIAPGLQMRFKALHEFTSKLPQVTPEGELPMIGYSTETAVRSGVVNGLIYEIDGYIRDLRKKYPDLFVFLTGGDTFFLAAKLKNSIFADTKLLIKGLNRILNYNADL
ncbi:MAG: type III pantothenate kinase [Candidatus Azobacteroides sp.]|nr:type III pantothenate kinase [Candidatus Azobacteroides sp.]